ncbi:MAG: hypothetical protein JNM17_38140 [Archangium sp.]|nr:hypothetical protein [Archangium sp.]
MKTSLVGTLAVLSLSLVACAPSTFESQDPEVASAEEELRTAPNYERIERERRLQPTDEVDVGALVCRMENAGWTRAQIARYLTVHELRAEPCQERVSVEAIVCRMLSAGYDRNEITRYLTAHELRFAEPVSCEAPSSRLIDRERLDTARTLDVSALVCRMEFAGWSRAEIERYLAANQLRAEACAERSPAESIVCRMLAVGYDRAEIIRYLTARGVRVPERVFCN